MRLPHTLLVAVTTLALALPASAELKLHQAPIADEAHVDARTTEIRIEHLEAAAAILTDAGLNGEARRLREQAALMRNELRNQHRTLEELRAALAQLRQTNAALKQQLAAAQPAPAQPAPAEPAPEAPDLEALAAAAHNQRTQETWNRIKQAAHGPRPLAPAPRDQVIPLEIPQAPPVVDVKRPVPQARADQGTLLKQILETLERIEEKMAE